MPVREFADEIDEESFRVNLTQVVNANIRDGQGVGTIRDDDRNGLFSCRATGLRIGDSEGGVANGPRIPCRDATSTPTPLALGLLSVTLTGKAASDQTPDALDGTAPQAGDRGTAHAEATEIVIRSGLDGRPRRRPRVRRGGDVHGVRTAGPDVELEGHAAEPRGPAVLTATAQATIPLVLATLRLNQRIVANGEVTQRALVLDNALGPDIVLGEARAGFAGTAVHPSGHPCVV